MEIRARYLTIGLFTLCVIAAGFLFVYWLSNAGGLGRREAYRIRFQGPVSGLFVGSPVTFNGLRVGEVTGLTLDPLHPKNVLAGIGVQPDIQIRSDTKVDLDFLGLTGAASVALTGGSAESRLLSLSGGELSADIGSSLSMTQSARAALQKLDGLLTETSDPMKSTIGNLNSFTSALARNSDRVDGILAGLERMTGGGGKKTNGQVVDLTPSKWLALVAKPPAGQIAISEPNALGALDTDKLVLDPAAGPETPTATWADALPKLMQSRLVQSFENAGLVGSVVRGDGSTSDYLLQSDIRSFRITNDGAPAAELELGVKILNAKGRVLAGRIFKAKAPLVSIDAKIAAIGLNDAFGRATQDLVGWTVGVVSALPPPKPEEAPVTP